MNILITGATGFIGGHLLEHLQTQYEIYALTRRPQSDNDFNKVHWIEQNLAQPLNLSNLPKHVDAIIHLAQSKLYKQFPESARDIFDINIYSTFQLLEYARKTGVQYFLFASSGGIYGYSYEKCVETDPVSPLNFYLTSKHTAELLIANYKQLFHTIVLRFFFVYGPGQKGMLISNLLHKISNDEAIVIEGKPGLRINPIYIEDAIQVFEPSLHLQKSKLFNVAGDEIVTMTDLVRMMEKVSGRVGIVTNTDRIHHGDLIGDNRRMKEVLKVHPKVSLAEGLSKMVSL